MLPPKSPPKLRDLEEFYIREKLHKGAPPYMLGKAYTK